MAQHAASVHFSFHNCWGWLARAAVSQLSFIVFSCIQLIVISTSTFTCTYARSDLQGQQSPVFIYYVIYFPRLLYGCYMACQTACRFYLKSLTSWGADLQGQQLPIFESFQFVVAYLHYCYYLFMGKRTLLARAAVPFPSLFS